MAFADLKLAIRLVKSQSNLEAHIKWVEYIAGTQFKEDWKASMQSPGHLKQLVDSARSIVETDIYAFGRKTGNIKESFTGKVLTSDKGVTLAVYSDPSIAPSKGPFKSGNPSDFSYAAFFEDPKFNTFLPPKDNPIDRRRFRPFFLHMSLEHSRITNEIGASRIFNLLRKRMPKFQSEKTS